MKLLAAVLLALAALPAVASAATVSAQDGRVVYAGATGAERSAVTVVTRGATTTVTETSAPLGIGAGCTPVDATTARCDGDRLIAHLGDGDDIFGASSSERGVTVDGGPGDDTIAGTRHADRLTGGSGNDQLQGYGGGDVLSGGAGNDGLDEAGRGGMTALCGPGDDVVASYGIPRVRGIELSRDCEDLLTRWGLLGLTARAGTLALSFRGEGCPLTFRAGGRAATIRVPESHRRITLPIGAAAVTIAVRERCHRGTRLQPAFRLRPAAGAARS